MRALISDRINTTQPELLFVLSAVAQYSGAVIAVGIFDQVEPQTVGWFRVFGASIALLAVSKRWWRGWSRSQLLTAALFGTVTALMNIFFYLAIDRIDLGKGVTIEFLGPIAVAAITTRSGRNAVALAFALLGVVVLGGVEIGDNALGLAYILLASGLWAGYIVFGARVARLDRGLAGLGVGSAIAVVATAPFGLPWSAPVWLSPKLLGLCLLIGLLSSAIGYGIDQFSLRRIPIRRFSLLLALLPVTAVFAGWLALGQRPSALDFAGVALVLSGLAIQERRQDSRPSQSDILTQ